MNDAVRVSVRQLVGLNRHGSVLRLPDNRVQARQSGDYRSPFKGRGMEFDESRPYQPGDDIRNIDWRVTARTGRTHTKMFREERERPVFLFVDYLPTMFFATRGRYKAVAAAHMASMLGWSAVHDDDRIGGMIFSAAEHHELRPRRGRATMLRLINMLVANPGWQQLPAAAPADAGLRALLRLRRLVRPGSLVYLLSDFRYLDDRVRAQLVQLARHNELVLVFISDPLERQLPPPGSYRVSDGEQSTVLDTFDRARVEAYRHRFIARSEQLQSLADQQGVHLLSYSTETDPLQFLTAVLRRREGGR